MERCDDPVTMVKESMKAQFPKHYIIAQPHELTQLRALVEPVTLQRQETGPRSESVTGVTPHVDDDKNGYDELTIDDRRRVMTTDDRVL